MDGFKILLYHSVDMLDKEDDLGIRVGTDSFRDQMRFLKEGGYDLRMLKAAVDSLERKADTPDKGVVITFDDGYKDNITNAAPIMEELGFRATFFVTFRYIGGVKTHPDREWQRWECMDRKDLKLLADKGHEIGSHACHHIDLCRLAKEARLEELRSSMEGIGSLVDRRIEFFSFPYGSFDEELIGALKREGYKAACTTLPGINDYSVDPYKLNRIEITRDDSLDDFKRKLGARGGDTSFTY